MCSEDSVGLSGVYDTVIESATRAKDSLNGCDIYSGCCTLKIDYAKVSTFHHHIHPTTSTLNLLKEPAQVSNTLLFPPVSFIFF
uniref:Uncharacterized protein n=1 Tax=Anopheles coluzzii TaxID=1518534 RepID=A0A8W7P6Z0_ANOCL